MDNILWIPKVVKHLKLIDYYSIFPIKLKLKRSDKYVALPNPSMEYTWENLKKSHTKKINSKYQIRCAMKSLNHLTDHILCQRYKIILSISSKNIK